MAIRSITDLNQMRPLTPVQTGVPVAQPGTTFAVIGLVGNDLNVSFTDGWFTLSRPAVPGGEVVRCLAAYCRLDEITWTSSTVAYGGVRIKSNMTMQGLLCFNDSGAPGKGTNLVTIFSRTDLPDGGVAGAEYYLEWGIDMPKRKIYRRVNGTVRLSDLDFPSGAWDNMVLAQRCCLAVGYPPGISLATTTPCNIAFRDLYTLEKTVDDVDSLWLGPRRVAPITVEEVVAPWIASDGTDAKTVWNKPIVTSADLISPYVSTDDERTEAQIKLTTTAVGNITAIALSYNARKPAGTASNLRTSIEVGGVASPSLLTALDTGMTNKRIFMSNKAPDDMPWTIARLKSATLKVIAGNS